MIQATPKRGRGRPPKSATTSTPAPVAKLPAIIESGKSYSLSLFKQITGLGNQGLRDCQDEGLRVIYAGKNAFVLGDDWLAFLANPKRKTRRWDSKS